MAVFGLYQMILLICIILFVLLANLYLYHHFPKPKHPLQDISYDVAIVLGYPCNADGSLSTVQKKRMETAINLYHKHSPLINQWFLRAEYLCRGRNDGRLCFDTKDTKTSPCLRNQGT